MSRPAVFGTSDSPVRVGRRRARGPLRAIVALATAGVIASLLPGSLVIAAEPAVGTRTPPSTGAVPSVPAAHPRGSAARSTLPVPLAPGKPLAIPAEIPLGEAPRDAGAPAGGATQDPSLPALADDTTGVVVTAPSPNPSQSFLGHLKGADDSIPPDTQGAVGPNHVVAAENYTVDIRDRSGTQLAVYYLDGFWAHTWGSAGEGPNFAFDPRILYDAANDRFVLIAVARGPGGTPEASRILVAVTQGSSPTGNWRSYVFASRNEGEATTLWADFPTMGQNAKWLAVAVNMFRTDANGTAYVEPRLWAFSKAALYAGSDCGAVDCYGAWFGTQFGSIWSNPVGEIFTLQPAVVHDAGQGDLVLAATWWDSATTYGTSQYLIHFRLTGSVGSELLYYEGASTASSAWSTFPRNGTAAAENVAPQAGTTNKIHNGDARLQKCVLRAGTLWCVHHIHLPAGGAATRTAIQWFRLTPSSTPGTAPALVEQARLDDPTGAVFRAYPSIDVNVNGDALIGWTRFSADTYPSAAYALRRATDAPGTIGGEVVLKAGEATYPSSSSTLDASGRLRWGDYSAVQVDPVDGTSLWAIQEYAATHDPVTSAGRWATWWGRVASAGGPSIPGANFIGTPTSGTAPLNVQFTDTSSNVPTSWSWTFGDGGVSTAQHPSHQYSAPGTYTVALTAGNAAGSDPETKSGFITVSAAAGAPVASFTVNPNEGTDPLSVTLTDTSTGSPTSRTWEVFDTDDQPVPLSSEEAAANPLALDWAPGIYSVQLTVANGNGTDAAWLDPAFTVYPVNDDFADALPINGLGSASTPMDATYNDTADASEAGEPDARPGCLRAQPGATIGRTVWYKVRLATNARVTIATADFTGGGPDSEFDTILEVGTGTSAGTYAAFACNDDYDPDPNVAGTPVQSRLVVALQANTDYHVRVGGWSGDYGALNLYLFGTADSTAPTVSLTSPLRLAKGPMTGSAVPVALAWSAADAGTGLNSFAVQRRTCSTSSNTCPGAWSTVKTGLPGSARSVVLPTSIGFYEYRVLAVDNAANAKYSNGVRIRLGSYQNSSTRVKLTAYKWKRSVADGNAWGGSYARSVGSLGRATLTVPAGTRQVAWVARVYSTAGTAKVYIDGVYKGTVNLRTASSPGWRRVVFVSGLLSTSRQHTIQVRWRSGTINVDAFVTAR